MPDYILEFREVIEAGRAFLDRMSDDASTRRPAPDKWNPREIVGHLIDSASNNHQRFVRAQFEDGLEFPGYDQDAWVSVQRYDSAPWRELVALWYYFNVHIAHVMESAANDERVRPRARHNLDRIAWKTIPRDQPATLDYFMRDYVGHLKHHLAQLGYPPD